MPERSPSTIRTRASLLARLKNPEDAESWREFDEVYRKLILAVGRQFGLRPEEAEDAAQDTLAAVAQHVAQFEYDRRRCTFKTWLLIIARQRIIWQLRKRRPGSASAPFPSPPDESARTATIERIADPDSLDLDAVWEREWSRSIYDAAVIRARDLVSARHFQIFDLLVAQQRPSAEVAKVLRVTRAQVYLAKHRVGTIVKREMHKLKHKWVAH